MILVKEEYYKFFSNKKNLFMVALLLVLMSVLCLDMINKHETYHKSEIDRYSSAVNFAESNVIVLLLDQKRNLRTINQDELAFWELESQLAQKLKVNYNFYDPNNWKMLLQTKIERNLNLMAGYEKNYITSARQSKKQIIASLTRENLLYQYFLDQNQQPYESPYELRGITFLNYILDNITPLLLMIIVSIFFLDAYAGEFEDGSYKFLYTQPYTRKQIYNSKILASVLCSIGTFAIIIILFTLGITLINGFGQTQYPFAISSANINTFFSDKLVKGVIVPLGEYLAHGYLMLVFLLLLTGSIIYFISLLTNSISTTVSIAISLFMVTYASATFIDQSAFNLIWPMSNFQILNQINSYGYQFSYLTNTLCFLFSISVLIIGMFIVRNKDLIGGKEA